MMGDNDVAYGCQDGMGSFYKLEEGLPFHDLIFREFSKLENNFFSVLSILSDGTRQAVRTICVALILADAPVEMEFF